MNRKGRPAKPWVFEAEAQKPHRVEPNQVPAAGVVPAQLPLHPQGPSFKWAPWKTLPVAGSRLDPVYAPGFSLIGGELAPVAHDAEEGRDWPEK